MAVESSELKFKYDKKGKLHVTYTEKEKTDAGDIITSKSPEKHDLSHAEENQKKQLFDALTETARRFLVGEPITTFGNKS